MNKAEETSVPEVSHILKVGPDGMSGKTLLRARDVLRSGGLVAYPTESFYGLGADARNEAAVRRLVRVKKRDPGRPVLILIPSQASLERYVRRIPSVAARLVDAFWPGGLTLVFEAGEGISPLLTGGSGRIGIRFSSHPVATALAQALDAPVTGTSANLSGAPPCRSAEAVIRSLGNGVSLVIDGGLTPGEAASTVLDVTVDPPVILRQGMILESRLRKVIGGPLEKASP